MSTEPKLTVEETEKLLLLNSFIIDKQKGSHRIYIKGSYRMMITHPAGEVLHPKIVKQRFELIAENK